MQGESLQAARLDATGVEGDRRLGLIDVETGHVVTAKHPHRWGSVLMLTATEDAIRFPDGTEIGVDDPEANDLLSAFFGRPVRLASSPPETLMIERVDPTADGDYLEAPERQEYTSVLPREAPTRKFVDVGPLHVLTVATLERLAALAPGTDFDPRRFRPNLLLDVPDLPPFTENTWKGRQARIGEVVLRLDRPTARCAVPSLAQPGLPA